MIESIGRYCLQQGAGGRVQGGDCVTTTFLTTSIFSIFASVFSATLTTGTCLIIGIGAGVEGITTTGTTATFFTGAGVVGGGGTSFLIMITGAFGGGGGGGAFTIGGATILIIVLAVGCGVVSGQGVVAVMGTTFLTGGGVAGCWTRKTF